MSSANEQEKLAQFRSLTGAPEQVARLYLDASNWDIEVPWLEVSILIVDGGRDVL